MLLLYQVSLKAFIPTQVCLQYMMLAFMKKNAAEIDGFGIQAFESKFIKFCQTNFDAPL